MSCTYWHWVHLWCFPFWVYVLHVSGWVGAVVVVYSRWTISPIISITYVIVTIWIVTIWVVTITWIVVTITCVVVGSSVLVENVCVATSSVIWSTEYVVTGTAVHSYLNCLLIFYYKLNLFWANFYILYLLI